MLDDWSRGRLRYHPTGKILVAEDDIPRSLCYAVYKEALRRSRNEDLIMRYNLDNVAFSPDHCKALSEWMKKKGSEVEKKWRYLVDLHRLGDFLPYKDDKSFIETIKYWCKPKLHTWLGNEEKWYAKFEECASRVMFRDGVSPSKFISIDDFIKNGDIWCTSGSGFEPSVEKMKVYDITKDQEIEVKKNKWSVRWEMSDGEAKHLLLRRRKQLCKAVQKSEPGKVRAVISSDVSTYLKMTYVSIYLDQIFKKRKDTTLWMNSKQREDLWQSMAFDGSWRMPLDQSEFDQMQTLRQVLIVIQTFRKLIKHFVHRDDILEILDDLIDKILFALDGGDVIVGGEKVAIRNGVLSGWRWTAMIDTFINLIEIEMGKDLYYEVTGEELSVLDINGQGDDDKLKIKYYKHCVGLWSCIESFGLKVNPGKFFCAKDRDEYLRRVYEDGKVTGYPARSITSIMFRNPISPQEAVGAARARENLTKWKLFCERLDTDFRGSWFEKRWMQDSIQGIHGMSKDILKGWLDQDCVVGGIGWNGGVLSDALIPTSAIENKDHIRIDSPGANEWFTWAESFGVPRSKAIQFVVSTLNIPIKNKIPKWVKYILTNEDIHDDIPHGMSVGKPGTVAVGMNVKTLAWNYGYKWFPSMSRLKHTRYYTNWELEQPRPFLYKNPGSISKTGKELLHEKENISRTLAHLSEKPELVWKQTYSDSLKHKPKSWQRDFYAGRLKSSTPTIAGWGSDVVGSIAQRYINSAINDFLLRNKPSINTWYSLQRKIVLYTLADVSNLAVRVVE